MASETASEDKGEKPETKELSAPARSYESGLSLGGYGELVRPRDPVFEGLGEDYDRYEALLTDGAVHTALQQRIAAVTSAEWIVEPGGDSAEDVRAADFIREQFQALPFDQICEKMLMALYWGYSVAECLWKSGPKHGLAAIRVRKPRRFGFDADGRLLLLHNLQKPEVMPEKKFWILARPGHDDDAVYGLGLAHYLYWPVYFRQNASKLWAVALEKFAMPTALGVAPQGTPEDEMSRFVQIVQAIHTDGAIALPDGFVVKLLESIKTFNASGHEPFAAFWTEEIVRIILSQSMTTLNGSSRAQSETHAGVKRELIKADADKLCESLNNGPIKWLTEWNFERARPPKIWRVLEASEDLSARAERDLKLSQASGLRPTKDYLAQTYGGEWEATASSGPASPGKTDSPAFAAPDSEPDAVEELARQLHSFAAPVFTSKIEQVRQLIEEVTSLEELSMRLMELRADMAPNELAAIMGQAMTVAELQGRADLLADG